MAMYIPQETYNNSINLLHSALDELETFAHNLPSERIFLFEGLLLINHLLSEITDLFETAVTCQTAGIPSVPDGLLYENVLLKTKGIVGILLIIADNPKAVVPLHSNLRSIIAKLLDALTLLTPYSLYKFENDDTLPANK